MNPQMQNRGFTLVELLITIGVIAVLAALIFPAMRKTKEAGLSAACASNFRNIGAAIFQYAADNDGFIPPGQSLGGTPYTGLYTPSRGVSEPQNNKAFLSWVYQDIVHDTTPTGQPIKGFACPAAMAKWPGLRHPTSKNFLFIYALNPRVGPPGASQPIFGYYPGTIPAQIPMRLVTANATAIADPDPRKDQRWFFQESDALGGVGASWDLVDPPPGPAHGNHRYRLCLDGHVERLTLAESNIEMTTP